MAYIVFTEAIVVHTNSWAMHAYGNVTQLVVDMSHKI